MITKKCPQCLKIFSDETRAKIIACLKKNKQSSVKEINSFFKLSQPTISHHLKTLKELGVLESEKNGKEVFYSINKKYSCPRCKIFNLPLFQDFT